MDYLSPDRRRQSRKSISITISFAPKRNDITQSDWYFGEMRNVSFGGACFYVEGLPRFLSGEAIDILCFPNPKFVVETGLVPYRITGQMVWLDRSSQQIGIRYEPPGKITK
ncbi:MAG: PilZ domain-containing protein [Desulfobacteraceae bacterium]|nr:PilZ domain-containing protein [Desulfobacteraceae bacterium]